MNVFLWRLKRKQLKLLKWFLMPFIDTTMLIGVFLVVGTRADSLPVPLHRFNGRLPAMFRPEVLYWEDDILRWASEYDLEPELIATVMQIESCGDVWAISSAGAQGLFQVMPFHFKGNEVALDINTNARRGLTYLSGRLNAAGGDVNLALAQYNGGHTRLNQSPSDWPSETQRYVRYGLPIYEDAIAGRMHSATLQDWYDRYGASLCRDAAATQQDRVVIRSHAVNFMQMVEQAAVELKGMAVQYGGINALALGFDIPGSGNGRRAVLIPNCVVAPSWPVSPRWGVRSPYKVPAKHTREGSDNGGLHGCFVGAGGTHWVGVDFAAGVNTDIVAPISGVITEKYVDGVGNTVLIIENPHYMVVLLHGAYDHVEIGTAVVRGGTVIGSEKSFGYSTGPHTHFQVYDKRAGGWVDPFAFFLPEKP